MLKIQTAHRYNCWNVEVLWWMSLCFGGRETDSLRHVLWLAPMVANVVRSGKGFEVCYRKDHFLQ